MALVRWRHPVRGVIPPEHFVPLAEQTDLLSALARWVLEEALEQLDAWRRSGLELSMAVNLSAAKLVEASLPEMIGDLLARWRLDPATLTVEITEGAIMVAQSDRTVRRLSNMGVGMSIDDFGTGYSALSYLKTLPVDEIKIDRLFVRDVARNPDDAAIVQPTIDLGHNLRLRVTAEGVEDQETWLVLESLGCDSAQGFYISKALPAAELERWLRTSEGGLGGALPEDMAARLRSEARVR
jgi:EAL domain-containing protein (putative c-di-GMP-specific phosphodiesterase class I)